MKTEPKLEKSQSGIAGEFYAAAELSRRNFNVSMTFGNTKAIDLLVERNGKNVAVQVKAIQAKKSVCWSIPHKKVQDDLYYILVQLNADDLTKSPEFFPLTGFTLKQLLKRVKSGRDYIDYNPLKKLGIQDNWEVFNFDFNLIPLYDSLHLESFERKLLSVSPSNLSDLADEFNQISKHAHENFRFEWMQWKEGNLLLNHPTPEFNSLPLNVLYILLFAVARADRFTEGLLEGQIANRNLYKIISAINKVKKHGEVLQVLTAL